MRIASLAVAAVAAWAFAPQAASAQAAQDAGMALYKASGVDCEMCHGWHGAGRYHDTTFSDVIAGGPSLQASKMTREQMVEIVSCGKMTEGRTAVMPYYRNDAWTRQLTCYGHVRNDIPPEQMPLPGLRQLTAAQVETVVDFVRATFVGKAPGIEYCRRYFGEDPKVCDQILQTNPAPAGAAGAGGAVVRPGQPAQPFRLPGTP